jgi:GTP-binding protein EngB required for normal cell division
MTVLANMDSTKEEWVALDGHFSSGLVGLQTDQSSKRLNQIDRVRAKGVGDHIPLPQLVVCGDQSAGKSSVLEGITNIPFPRQEGLCTRFATEIILRHQPGYSRITATILPSASRAEEERLNLTSFERQLMSFDDLPRVIQEASALMGLVGVSGTTGHDLPTFAADVLRLEVVGDTKLHLTVVDLPGLISVSENAADVQIVSDLVDKYLESSRTIILAVVPAANDIDTQGIIQRARKFDSTGERTVGIITKPDLINKGAESRVASLASNKDRVKLKLGFFLLKNPSPNELQEAISWTERQQREIQFFACSPWKEQNLDRARIGIEKLRGFLQQLLDSHIERELPKVRKDVRMLLSDTERQLVQIGPERSSCGQIRMYLVHISMEFHNIVKAAINGNYDGRDLDYFNKADTRLRARVHIENENFATYMRTKSMKRKICDEIENDKEDSGQGSDSDGTQDSIVPVGEDGDGQLRLTRREMIGWVKQVRISSL